MVLCLFAFILIACRDQTNTILTDIADNVLSIQLQLSVLNMFKENQIGFYESQSMQIMTSQWNKWKQK